MCTMQNHKMMSRSVDINVQLQSVNERTDSLEVQNPRLCHEAQAITRLQNT